MRTSREISNSARSRPVPDSEIAWWRRRASRIGRLSAPLRTCTRVSPYGRGIVSDVLLPMKDERGVWHLRLNFVTWLSFLSRSFCGKYLHKHAKPHGDAYPP